MSLYLLVSVHLSSTQKLLGERPDEQGQFMTRRLKIAHHVIKYKKSKRLHLDTLFDKLEKDLTNIPLPRWSDYLCWQKTFRLFEPI